MQDFHMYPSHTYSHKRIEPEAGGVHIAVSVQNSKNIHTPVLIFGQNEFFTEYEKSNDSEHFQLYLKFSTQLFKLWNNEVEIS